MFWQGLMPGRPSAEHFDVIAEIVLNDSAKGRAFYGRTGSWSRRWIA